MAMHREKLLQLFVRDRGHYLGFLRVICRDVELAEDLFQDLSVVVVAEIDSYDQSRDFGAWVRGIARNLHRKALAAKSRRLKVQRPFEEKLTEAVARAYDGRDLQEEDEKADLLHWLRKCLAATSGNHRRLLQDRYEKNLSSAQIAALYDKNVPAIDTAICRIRSALLRCVEQQSGNTA